MEKVDFENKQGCKKPQKQAVVVIHGMGEQRPMETIRTFVRNVWMKDSNLVSQHFWNKPSTVSYSFEQRRLTTNAPKTTYGSSSKRTDFYEYYWAFKTVGTTWEHFLGWFRPLFFCIPTKYGKHTPKLIQVWLLLWVMLVITAGLFIVWYMYIKPLYNEYPIATMILSIIEILCLGLINRGRKAITKSFGDVARYVEAKPCNIKIRQEVRKDGIELIERIHQTGDYERIILVGHSLGSIVAYDILNHLWGRHNKFKYTVDENERPCSLSKDAIKLADELLFLAGKMESDSFNQEEYRNLQSDLFEELKRIDKANNWLISDFITLGSPLTYADFLIFPSKQTFNLRKLDREYPTSPPIKESGHYYYQSNGDTFLHHGAVFAPVKWTNIYCPSSFIGIGDIISGRVSNNFSYKKQLKDKLIPIQRDTDTPIKELKLAAKEMGGGFTHTKYWKTHNDNNSENTNLTKLREALKLYK